MTAAAIGLGLLALGPGPAMGAETTAETIVLPPEDPGEPEVKRFNFEGDTISTDYLKPGTLLIEGLRRGRRSSLIEVRMDFVAELMRSAEDI